MTRIIEAGKAEGSMHCEHAGELAVVFWICIKGLALQKAVEGERFDAPSKELLLKLFQ
jgi:hypothetical protein